MATEPIGRRIAPRSDAPVSFCLESEGPIAMPTVTLREAGAARREINMSTIYRLIARNAVWLGAALLLMVAACGEQGGEEAEETPPATTQQQ